MTSLSKKSGSVGTLLAAALATGLAGGALHTAAYLSAAPRSLGSFGRLMGPAAIACGALAVIAFALFSLAVPLSRRLCSACCSPGVVIAAIGTTLVVAAGTWPLGVAGSVNKAHLFVWLLAAVSGGLVVAGLARLGSERARSLVLLGVPIAALFVLAAMWAHTYSSAGLGLALAVLGLLALPFAWRVLPGVPALPVLFALAGAIAASGAGGLLRGDGELRNHRARPFEESRPSPVILITIDTLRPDFLSHARADGAVTPTLDALMGDSIVFRTARSSAPWTKPSVATILTGVSPLVHGTVNRRVRLPKELHTLAEHMRDAGYVTAGMGLNVHLEANYGFAQGFDQYWFPVRKEWGDSMGSKLLEALDPKRYPALFPTTEALSDVAVDWLDNNQDRDFFLWIHFLDPHWPYEPPAEYLPPREKGQHIGARWGDHETVTEVQAGTHKLGPEDQARVRALYRGEIEYVDAELGRIIAKLQELGLYDQALIAFTSDHGEEFWEHGRYEHGHTLYDEVLRVPLSFKLPGTPMHIEIDAPVGNEALTPTLLELAGVQPQQEFTASSLTRFFDSEAEPQPMVEDGLAAGTYYYNEKRMLESDGLKIIVDSATGRIEVYDLVADPQERQPLGMDDPRVAPLLQRLKNREAELEALREKLQITTLQATTDAGSESRLGNLGYGGNDAGAADE